MSWEGLCFHILYSGIYCLLLLGHIAAIARCGLLLQMGVVWSVCLLVTFVSHAEMAGLIEMPFGTDSGEPKEPYITWVEIPREGQFRGFQSIEKH